MKNILVLTMVLVLFVVPSAFSAENEFTSGEIVVGSNDTAEDLTIGLSPKVAAKYVNPGTSDSTAQWFSIATAHPGGNRIYATAQNLNNIYTKEFTTGTALETDVLDIPGSSNSASDWSTNGWSL